MQQLVIIMLKPFVSLTRYDASGWRKASLELDTVDSVIVRLLRSGWRLLSADSSAMYFTLETVTPKPYETQKTVKIPIPSPIPSEPPAKSISQPLQKGDKAEYQRSSVSYDKPVVAPVYVRPMPPLIKEQEIPQPSHTRPEPEKVDLDEWLKS